MHQDTPLGYPSTRGCGGIVAGQFRVSQACEDSISGPFSRPGSSWSTSTSLKLENGPLLKEEDRSLVRI